MRSILNDLRLLFETLLVDTKDLIVLLCEAISKSLSPALKEFVGDPLCQMLVVWALLALVYAFCPNL